VTRTSPKFFKSNQLQPASFKGQYLVNNFNNKSTTHHSITVSSSSSSSSHPAAETPTNAQQQQHQLQKTASQLNHVATTCDYGINNNTGIKQGPLNGKSHAILKSADKRKAASAVTSERVKNRTNLRKMNAVIVESVSIAPEVQSDLFHVPPLSPLHHLESETFEKLTRDERITQRKIQLRRRMQQFKGIQQYRTTERSKMRFSKTLKLLKHLDRAKDEM
jgi:hypothetical protein